MKKSGLAVLTGVLLVIVGCSTVKSTDVLNFVLTTDHYELRQAAYGSHPRQQVDVYLPKATSDKPPVVFVYGGAWREGERADYTFVAHALTDLGHPVIIPDYRLYPEVKFPLMIEDVAAALRYIEVNSGKLLGKPLQPYVLMGHSSGAHAAALLAADRRYLKKYAVGVRPAGLIAIAGPHDLPLDDPEVSPVFAGASAQMTQPPKLVHAGMPPVLLLHGEDDRRVYPFHSRNFDKALRQAGVPVKTLIYKGVDHVQIIGSLAAPLRMLNNSYEDVRQFLHTINNANRN